RLQRHRAALPDQHRRVDARPQREAHVPSRARLRQGARNQALRPPTDMTRSVARATRVLQRLAQLVAMLALFTPAGAFAREVPKPQGHVTDTAGMLSADAAARLEQKLVAYEQRTQQQFALLTIDSLDGDPLEDFSIR